MSEFEDHLWREFVREHGDALAQTSMPRPRPIRRGRRLVAGTSLALAGVGAAVGVALMLGAGTSSPAFAVTRNHDGTVTISINRSSGVAGANARLRQLGIRAKVTSVAPSDCQTTSIQQGVAAPSHGVAHWTINPRKGPAGQMLLLTPPPAPAGGNSGDSGNSGSGGGGSCFEAGTEGPGPGPPPPGNGGNSGNS